MSNQEYRTRKMWHYGFLAVVIFISLIMKINYEHALSYWLDEGYTAWFAELSFHDIWFWLPEIESHPPLYYSLVKLWGLLEADDTGLWHRSLSIFISLLLVIASSLTTKKIAKYLQIDGGGSFLFNAFLICFSPVIFWYSVEARPYILLFLAYSLAILGLVSIIKNREEATVWGWILFAFGALLTNWSHHLGGIFTAVLFLSLLVHWGLDRNFRKNFLVKFLICAVFVLVLSAPLIIQILRQVVYWDASNWVMEPTLIAFFQIMRRIYGFGFADKFIDTAFGFEIVAYPLRIVLGLAIGSLSLGLFLYGAFKMIRMGAISLASFFLLSCFAVPAVTFFISIVGPNVFLERTLLPGLIPFFILIAIAIEFINSRFIRRGIKVFFVLVVLLGLTAILREGDKEPWDDIMDALVDEVGENDVVLLIPNDLYLPARLYVSDPQLAARIHSVPAKYPAVNFSDFYPDGFPAVPGIRDEDKHIIQELTASKDRVFLITRQDYLFDPDDIARKTLAEQFTLEDEFFWGEIEIDRYDRN